jgi:hypothetical protein
MSAFIAFTFAFDRDHDSVSLSAKDAAKTIVV